jgi:hypothetical protein
MVGVAGLLWFLALWTPVPRWRVVGVVVLLRFVCACLGLAEVACGFSLRLELVVVSLSGLSRFPEAVLWCFFCAWFWWLPGVKLFFSFFSWLSFGRLWVFAWFCLVFAGCWSVGLPGGCPCWLWAVRAVVFFRAWCWWVSGLSGPWSVRLCKPFVIIIMFWAFAFDFSSFQQLSQGCGVLLCLVLVVSGLSGPWSVHLCKPFVIICCFGGVLLRLSGKV